MFLLYWNLTDLCVLAFQVVLYTLIDDGEEDVDVDDDDGDDDDGDDQDDDDDDDDGV